MMSKCQMLTPLIVDLLRLEKLFAAPILVMWRWPFDRMPAAG